MSSKPFSAITLGHSLFSESALNLSRALSFTLSHLRVFGFSLIFSLHKSCLVLLDFSTGPLCQWFLQAPSHLSPIQIKIATLPMIFGRTKPPLTYLNLKDHFANHFALSEPQNEIKTATLPLYCSVRACACAYVVSLV